GMVDNDCREFHDQNGSPGQGSDSQCFSANTGNVFTFQNNFMSAASENLMFGGTDPSVTNTGIHDVTVVGNHFWKDYTAWLGASFVVKNALEFKNAAPVLVDGNVLNYDWADAQSGFIFLITPQNQSGTCPACGTQDITFTHNLLEHAASGINILGSDDSNISTQTNRVLTENNVL